MMTNKPPQKKPIKSARANTKSKQSEKALKESEERYKKITGSITDYIYTVKVEKDRAIETLHGEGCMAITGYSAGEFTGDPFLWIHMVVPEDRVMVEEQARRILAKEEASAIEHRIIRKDGIQRWIRNTVVPRHNDQGELISYDGLIQDITERKTAEEKLIEKEERYRVFFNNISDAVFIQELSAETNMPGKFIELNESAGGYIGYTREELLKMTVTQIDAPETLANGPNILKRLLAEGHLIWEGIHLSKDGRRIPVEINNKIFKFHGKPMILATARDITERKRAEKLIGDALQFNKTILAASPIGIITYKASGQCVSANEYIAIMVGTTVDQLLKQNFYHLESWKKSGMLKLAEEALALGIEKREDIQVVSTFGKEIWFNCRFVPFQYRDEPHLLAMFTDINDRKRAEKNLMESEERFRVIFDNATDGILLADPETKRFYLGNKAICQKLGYSEEEIKNLGLQDIHPEKDLPYVQEQFGKQTRREIELASDIPVERKDGSIFYADINSFPLTIAGKQYIAGIFRDITERKRTAEELIKSERILSGSLKALDGLLIILDRDFRVVTSNWKDHDFVPLEVRHGHPHCYEVFKQLQSHCDYCPPRDTFKDGKFRIYEDRNPVDGSYKEISVSPVFNELDQVIMVVQHVRDITERKHAEQALKENEQKLRNIIEHSNELYYVHDTNNILTYISPQSLQILGYSPDEMMIDWTNLLTDNPINESGVEITEKALKTGEKQGLYVLELFKKDRSRVLLEIDESPIKNEKGVVVGLAGAARDVTEHLKAEEALKASEAELHDNYFAQSAINMVLSESLEDRPLEEFLQKALNMILSVHWLSFEAMGSIHLVEGEKGNLSMKASCNLPEQLKKMCAHVVLGKCLCGKAAQSQKIQFADHIDERHDICYKGIPPHGHFIVPLVFHGKTLGVLNIYLKEGHIRILKEEEFLETVANTLAGIIARKQAEKERKKLHTQLLQAQKMEAVGQLAGGVAHDFNNILTAIIGYGYIMKTKIKEDDPLRDYADHILALSDKAANLTKSLLAFSRKQIIDPRPVDLNEIIKRIDHLLSRIIGEDIRLQTILSDQDLIVMADPGQIEQVLMNLATNARDAMPEGGLLTIKTETEYIDHEFIRKHGFGKEGLYALIKITDTGMGMDRETREKIFEPFFTTKEVGKGTGLGLAMVYGIINQHGGHITVYSESGRGTTFRILLLLIKAAVQDIKPEVIQAIEKGTETVLLAEDKTEVREITKRLLKENGYQVITAVDGQDAINQFKMHKNKIQFALLDVIMPNKSGKEVYDEIKKIKPDIKVLFMSGHSANVIHKHGILQKGFPYIEKPASPAKLLKKIREILNE